MAIDLTEDERQALIELLAAEIASDRFRLSPRLERLKRIKAKLSGEEPRPEPPRRPRSRSR